MPYRGCLFGRFISLAFHRADAATWDLSCFQLSQNAHNVFHVVTVRRDQISDVHALKDVLLMADGRFQCVVQSDDAFAAVVVQIAASGATIARLWISDGCRSSLVSSCNRYFHSAHGMVDAHVVIVQNDE